jgi:hypothetical protein
LDQIEPKPNRSRLIWNILSILMVVLIIGLMGFFASIFINPYSDLNPYPPMPLPTLMTFPTETNTTLPLPTVDTTTATFLPSETSTMISTWTPIPSSTPFQLWTSAAPTNTPDPSGMAYQAIIDYVDSSYYHPEAGCNWMGVAGQAVDINNAPVLYLAIHISGSLGGKYIDYISATGTAPNYGRSGFEFYLGDKPLASINTLTIQLTDQQSLPLTEPIKLTTFGDCSKNLVLIRFKQVH